MYNIYSEVYMAILKDIKFNIPTYVNYEECSEFMKSHNHSSDVTHKI